MDLHKRQREHSIVDKTRTKALGEERISERPRCYCGQAAPYFSRYCKEHAFQNKRWGHPELRLKINTRASQDDTRLLGREVMEFMATADPAWERIVMRIEAIARDPAFRFDIPTLVRRQSSWRQPFIAAGLLGMQARNLNNRWGYSYQEISRGFIESHIGMAARFFHGNELFLTARQVVFGINKNGGRAVVCDVPIRAKDEYDPEKVWHYRKREGVITAVGKIVSEEISKEFGNKWWRFVGDAVERMPYELDHDLPFLSSQPFLSSTPSSGNDKIN